MLSILRRASLVPEIAGNVNTQVAEQKHRDRKLALNHLGQLVFEGCSLPPPVEPIIDCATESEPVSRIEVDSVEDDDALDVIKVNDIRFEEIDTSYDGDCMFRAVGILLDGFSKDDASNLRALSAKWAWENKEKNHPSLTMTLPSCPPHTNMVLLLH